MIKFSKLFLLVILMTSVVCAQQTSDFVKYEFFRNATAKLTYGPKNAKLTFLLDPMLSKKGELLSFAGIEKNPTVDLPKDIDYIIKGIDAVIVSHVHIDHFDMVAVRNIDTKMPIITPYNRTPIDPQNLEKTVLFSEQLKTFGFINVLNIGSDKRKSIRYKGIEIIQEFALHGKGELKKFMGGVNGIILRAKNQPTIYWTSDSILDEEGRAEEILKQYRPDIIIAHTGGALVQTLSPNPLMMDEKQAVKFILAAKKYNPKSKIIAIHMNSLDHCFTTRKKMKKAIKALDNKMSKDVIIPNDGDIVIIPANK